VVCATQWIHLIRSLGPITMCAFAVSAFFAQCAQCVLFVAAAT
jgi:hypothetical protein